MTVRQLREAMKGLKGDVYVEVVMPADKAGSRWHMAPEYASKKGDRFQLRINNPM